MNEDNSTYHAKDSHHEQARRLPRLGRLLLRPRMLAALVVVVAVAVNATGAFGLNVLGLHSALTASSIAPTLPPPTYGFISETSTTCGTFSGSNAPPLAGGLVYTVGSKGTISLVNPPQFYYFVGVKPTTNSTGATYTITETISPSTYKHFLPLVANGSQVFNSSCTKVANQTIKYNSTTGITTVTFPTVANQVYFIALKFSASNGLVGAPPPPAGTTYTFKTNGADAATVGLSPK